MITLRFKKSNPQSKQTDEKICAIKKKHSNCVFKYTRNIGGFDVKSL